MVIQVIVLVLFVVFAEVNPFPETVQRCRAGDTKCLASTITRIIHEYPAGIPELGLPSIDPLYFGSVSLIEDGNNPVSVNLSINDGYIGGWSRMVVTKVIGFDKDPKTSKFEIEVKVPVDAITGQYTLFGKLLLIPVHGKGNFNVTLGNVGMKMKLVTKTELRNNEEYLHIRKVLLEITAEKFYNNLENLLDNPELSEQLNKVFNESADLIFESTKHSFSRVRGGVLRKLIQPIFDRFPYRDMFLE